MKINLLIIIVLIFFCAIQNSSAQKSALGTINARAIYLPKPEYTEEAKRFCAGGKVEVEVLVDENGDVIEAKAISGDRLLRDSSVDAVKRAKFARIEHSNAARTKGIIVYNFDFYNKCLNLGIVNKKALKLPKPPILDHLKIKKDSIVGVEIIVNESGNVIYANTLSGHPILKIVCEAAARHAKFSPIFTSSGSIKARALLIYKFKTDRTIETNIANDDKDVAVTPTNLVEPIPPFCNCRFGDGSKVTVIAEINEQGKVFKAEAVSGHPLLKVASEKATLQSAFLPVNFKSKAIITYSFKKIDQWSVEFSEAEIKNAKDLIFLK